MHAVELVVELLVGVVEASVVGTIDGASIKTR